MIRFIELKRGQQQIKYAYTQPVFKGNAFLPQHAVIPLSFQTDTHTVPLVSAGDTVREGQIIARAADGSSAHIHASVPGSVSGFVNAYLPGGKLFTGIHIRTEGRFDFLGKTRESTVWRDLEEAQLLERIRFAGLINTAQNLEPLVEALIAARTNNTTALTAVLYDKDPTCRLDSFLTAQFLTGVMEGLAIAARTINAQTITIEHSMGKKNGALHEAAAHSFDGQEVRFIPTPASYPIENPAIVQAEENAFVIDAYSALSLYESVVYNEPMLTSYIMLTGKTIDQATVLKVRIGTPIGNIIEECGGFKTKNTHIILNGLLSGILADSLDLPIGKGIKSIHAAGTDIEIQNNAEECGHCGYCLRSCPAYLDPIALVRALENSQASDAPLSHEVKQAIQLCSGCGNCSAVCPARIPLSTLISRSVHKKETVW
ncbi:MAG: 4Fe-4S dicluster domain-containing protein [Treponema sp.]